jgi:hypothetical protein
MNNQASFFPPKQSGATSLPSKAKVNDVIEKESSVWNGCPILDKPCGWMTTVTKAFTVEDPKGHFCQATKASDGVEVKHRTLICTLGSLVKEEMECHHPTPC